MVGWGGVGGQSLPPQNLPFGDVEYFKLIIFTKEKPQEKSLTFPSMPKRILKDGLLRKRAIMLDNCSLTRTTCVRRGGTQRGPFDPSPVCVPGLNMSQQTLIYQHLLFCLRGIESLNHPISFKVPNASGTVLIDICNQLVIFSGKSVSCELGY